MQIVLQMQLFVPSDKVCPTLPRGTREKPDCQHIMSKPALINMDACDAQFMYLEPLHAASMSAQACSGDFNRSSTSWLAPECSAAASLRRAASRPLLPVPSVCGDCCPRDPGQAFTTIAQSMHPLASSSSDDELVGFLNIITTCGHQAAIHPYRGLPDLPDEHFESTLYILVV